MTATFGFVYESDAPDASPKSGPGKFRVWQTDEGWFVAADWFLEGRFVGAKHLTPSPSGRLVWSPHEACGRCDPLSAAAVCDWLREQRPGEYI